MFDFHFQTVHLTLNIFIIISIGLFSGVLSGILGIGGGIVSTPLLVMYGIPPQNAIACSTQQIIGSSCSGILKRIKHSAIDLELGIFLSLFALLGVYFGGGFFSYCQKFGNIDFVISVMYLVVMLSSCVLNLNSLFKKSTKTDYKFAQKLPWKIYFKTANIEISSIGLAALGTFAGFLSVMMGIGGGIVIVPMLCFFFGVDRKIAVGTSLVQVFCAAITSLFVYGVQAEVLDIMLGFILMLGSTIGIQIGTTIQLKSKNEKLSNILFAILTLLVAIKFGINIFHKPDFMITIK